MIPNYKIKPYKPGVEAEQAQIGGEVARGWVWPFAYDQEDLEGIHARPDFDPETRYYAYFEDQMVGYTFANLHPPGEDGEITAVLDFPRVTTGHEDVAEPLASALLDTLRAKGVTRVTGRVSTMNVLEVPLAQRLGFTVKDWGYKVYYSYRMAWGTLDVDDSTASEIAPGELEAAARLAMKWYQQSQAWCKTQLDEWHASGLIITHSGVRHNGELSAACLAAPNVLRPSTAAVYYIYTPDEISLRSLIGRIVNKCIAHGTDNLIVDLIHDHRQYEPFYLSMGFEKAAEWGLCELTLI